MKKLVVCVFILMASSFLYADGCKFPARGVKVMPEIPVQQAIVKYKDGVETMSIYSSYKGEGDSFAWIVPVPNEPISFKESSQGLIETVELNTRPTIFYYNLMSLSYVISLVFCEILFILYFLISKRYRSLFSLVVGTIFVVFISSFVFMPSLGTIKGVLGGDDGIVKKEVVAGNYDVVVLKPAGISELNSWLFKNGFEGVPAVGVDIVENYIKSGWYFTAAKLRQGDFGEMVRTHPIEISFNADKCVYPVQLTSLSGVELYLELYVISDGRAFSDERLVEEFRMKYKSVDEDSGVLRFSNLYNSSRDYIQHPKARDLLYEGCIVTRFAGMLSVEGMQASDIELGFETFDKVFIKTYFSTRSAVEAGVDVALVVVLSLLVLICLINRGKLRVMDLRGRVVLLFKKCLPMVLLVGMVAGGLTYIKIDKVNSVRAPSVAFLFKDFVFDKHFDLIVKVIESGDGVDSLSELKNPYFLRSIREGDSPGDYEFIEDGDSRLIRVYNSHGGVSEHVLKSY